MHATQWSLRTRLILIMVFMVSVTLTVIMFSTILTVRRVLARQIGEKFISEGQTINDLIGLFFCQNIGFLQELATSQPIDDAVRVRNASYAGSDRETIAAAISRLDAEWMAAGDASPLVSSITVDDHAVNPAAHQLARFLRQFPMHTEVFVTDKYGATVGATGRLSDYNQGDEEWWRMAWNGGMGDIYVSDPVYDESAGLLALMIAVPVLRDGSGEVIGVLRSTLDVGELLQLVDRIKFGRTGRAVLLKRSGEPVGQSDRKTAKTTFDGELLRTLLARIPDWCLADDGSGKLTLFAHAPLGVQNESRDNGKWQSHALDAMARLGWTVVVQQSAAEALASAAAVKQTTITVGFLLVGLATVVIVMLSRAVTRPLVLLCSAAEKVGTGELDLDLPRTSGSEMGALVDSFRTMTSRLREQHHKILDGMQLLRNQADEVMSGVPVLTLSSANILASASQLAHSAAQTASAVAETTTTVEEVRQTAKLSNDKAQAVSAKAMEVEQTAHAGQRATKDACIGIKHIREQMDSIADGMIQLSEQTQAIGQILATVDDIAAQSNILAVNAAIEACKAGEQGKGFTVVAREVRNLAEQSRQATGQVRKILADIQKATSAAVMATEQGTKAVEAGESQSVQAGESIEALAGNVIEAARAAIQISASNQQQLAGMEQVVGAMESIRQASEQNVAGARQLEASARDLNELGSKLQELVARYRV